MSRPCLACPDCGKPDLIPAHDRGRFDRDGNEIIHADTCRCRWCDWLWWDTAEPVRCGDCGARVRVRADDGHAYAEAIT